MLDVLAGLLAILAGLGGGAGYFVDRSARDLLVDQLDSVDTLEVRVQSQPNYQLLGGEIDRVLVAGRGLYIAPYPRIDLVEIETDRIDLNIASLTRGPVTFDSPLRAAARVSITEADLNASLRSPEILAEFQGLSADLPFGQTSDEPQVLDLVEPKVDFLAGDRLVLSAQLVSRSPDATAPSNADDSLDVTFTAGVVVERGQRLRLIEPEFELDEVPVPRELSDAFLGGLNEALDLSELVEQGIFARVLDFQITNERLEVVGFIQVDSFADLQGN
ncbi:MAG: DUF2993 domain-containing protein [Cyanobacteria bacterium J06648_11]